ncbi:response regulator transcription factor [Aliiglaciecola sp. 2_MG-2023]|uniref:response regulator n=1 Tax=unclassified Aliiglaciecola TaxID=2593648 RepID=UPI0026E25C99|nr:MULTISPECIES: response regulator transcription factor [unclassified Aliiglaciecola]MDO6711493.1 response regulator transcription factor [Aliiglaciecola sp. 2_MG-2023]MDO6752530.1 response regulator transcription factor [Aliiglaciecola sp. 1_MG-2023]
MSINVMVVDDQTLVREGIKSLLSLAPEINIVAEAADGKSALNIIATHKPDVVLMDIRMPIMNGIETVEALNLKAPAEIPPVIMLTTFDEHQLVIQAIQAGAKGYLLKDVSLETLVEAIVKVHSGETLIQPSLTQRVLKSLQGKETAFESSIAPIPLSAKEVEILRLIAAGCSNREISELIFKSEGTVKNQVSNVLDKLGVRDRTRAVLKAIELGFI